VKRRDPEQDARTPDAPPPVRREPVAPPPHPVLALQAAAGNAATARLLQRQVSYAEPNVSYADEDEYTPGDQVTVNTLSPEDQRKLTYARSMLARVEPLPAADEEVLRKLVPGTLIVQLIQERDDARKRLEDLVAEHDSRLGKTTTPSDRWMGPTDPVGDPDVLGGSPFAGETGLPGLIDQQRARVEQLDGAITQACQALGIPGEKEFKDLIESRFPDLFLARAKTIALKMLDENERLVRAEAARMGIDLRPWEGTGFEGTGSGAHAGEPVSRAQMDVLAGVRAGAQELHTMQLESEEAWKDRVAANEENVRQADDEDYDWRTDEGSYWAPDLNQRAQATADEHAQREAAFAQRRDELGLKYPILFRIDDYSKIALASDEEIQRASGSELRDLLENITKTRENIAEGKLKVWNLNEVFDITTQDLGITPASPLYVAVEKKVAEEEHDESILNIAKTALGIAAAIVGAVATGGVALVGTAVAAGVGVSQLAESVSSFLAEGAASDVSLDPVLADISKKSPDLKAVAFDIAALGFDAFDVMRIVKLIAGPVRAARATGDLVQLAGELRAIEGLGERGLETVMASVGREAEIQAGVVRLIKAAGTRFRPADLAQVVADLARYDQKVVADALQELIAAGRVRALTRRTLGEVYADNPARVKKMIQKGYLDANGYLDKTYGVLFLREATLESMSSTALHEVVHFLQDVHRPLMSRFHQEFEAYAAQRHYLQQLWRSGVDPDMAFPSHKWLLNASNEDIVAHLAGHPIYGFAPDAGLNLDDAVIDALASLTRSERVAEGAGAATEAAKKATK
jgi:hypothetical protein